MCSWSLIPGKTISLSVNHFKQESNDVKTELCQLAEALARAREKSSLGDEILALMNQTGKFPLTSLRSGPRARGPALNHLPPFLIHEQPGSSPWVITAWSRPLRHTGRCQASPGDPHKQTGVLGNCCCKQSLEPNSSPPCGLQPGSPAHTTQRAFKSRLFSKANSFFLRFAHRVCDSRLLSEGPLATIFMACFPMKVQCMSSPAHPVNLPARCWDFCPPVCFEEVSQPDFHQGHLELLLLQASL